MSAKDAIELSKQGDEFQVAFLKNLAGSLRIMADDLETPASRRTCSDIAREIRNFAGGVDATKDYISARFAKAAEAPTEQQTKIDETGKPGIFAEEISSLLQAYKLSQKVSDHVSHPSLEQADKVTNLIAKAHNSLINRQKASVSEPVADVAGITTSEALGALFVLGDLLRKTIEGNAK